MSRKWYFVSTVILGIIIMIFINTTPKMNSKQIPKTSSISTNIVFNKNVSPKVIPIGRLIIEKIKLDQALYDINSPNNNVEENVTILKGSSLPTDNKGIIFLAAHSGTGDIAYFNDLDKLKVTDEIIFKYNNINYHYLVDKIFEEEKDGLWSGYTINYVRVFVKSNENLENKLKTVKIQDIYGSGLMGI